MADNSSAVSMLFARISASCRVIFVSLTICILYQLNLVTSEMSPETLSQSSWPSGEETRKLASEPSSSDTNSPPPSRSTGGLLSDDSTNAEGSEDNWKEIKVRFSLTRLSRLYMRLLTIIASSTSKFKPNRSSTPSKASYPASAPRHLRQRSTKTSLKLSSSYPASSLSATTTSHLPLPNKATRSCGS